MVIPDTINTRLNDEIQEVDSVGTLFKNIHVSTILCNSILKNSENELNKLRKEMKNISEKISYSI